MTKLPVLVTSLLAVTAAVTNRFKCYVGLNKNTTVVNCTECVELNFTCGCETFTESSGDERRFCSTNIEPVGCETYYEYGVTRKKELKFCHCESELCNAPEWGTENGAAISYCHVDLLFLGCVVLMAFDFLSGGM